MTIVLADGTVAHTGGKVVKNVAGYDLHKLMIGAFGTLGVITSVNFRLHAIPRCTQSFTVSAPTAEPLGKLLLTLLHAQLSTLSIQLRGTAEGFDLDIQLASLPEVLRTQAAALEALAQSGRPFCTERGRGGLEYPASNSSIMISHARPRCFLQKSRGLRNVFAAMGGESVTQATGIMMASFPAAAAAGLPQLRRDLEDASGSLMVLKQPAEASLDCWGTLPDSFP